MDTETRLSGFGLALLGAFLVLAIVFAASASISDRSGTAKIAPPDARQIVQLAKSPDLAKEASAYNAVAGDTRRSNASNGAFRTKVRCAGCGVVESVRRVERREIATGVCNAMDSERFWMSGNVDDSALHAGALSPVAGGVFTGPPGARMPLVRSTYQLVVRFRDGSRHVFNEATPRTLRLGEPVQVIAGADMSVSERP